MPCSVSATISCTVATSQPVHIAVIWERSRSICCASAPCREKTNCAYAALSTARRLIRPPWKNGRPKARVLDFAMTVLSRSKNAAARVTSHDCKSTCPREGGSRAVHTRMGHPQIRCRPGRCCPGRRGVGAVPATTPARARRPLVVSGDGDLVDDLLRLLAAAGAEAELATGGPALRRAHRSAPLVLVGADVLPTPAVRALPRRAGVVVVSAAELPAADWATAVELGAERVARLPADEAWLLSRCAAAVRSPVEAGWLAVVGGSCGGAGASTVAAALAVAAAPGSLLVDGDAGGGGLDLLLGAERAEGLRWPELVGLRGRVAGDALLASLPESDGVHVLAASRAQAVPVPPEALLAVALAGRSNGTPVVVDLPRGDPVLTEPVLAEADLAVLVVPGRLRAASAARLLLDGAWSSAVVVARSVPGGPSRREVADVLGRQVFAELGHDRSAAPRGERGEPPVVSARSPLGVLTRRLLAELPRRTAAAA